MLIRLAEAPTLGVRGGRSGAAGAGRTWPRPRRRRWSAGRRRTPTSLGCARPRKARGGPSQGSPGCARKHPAPPGAPFPLRAREKEKGERATPGARKSKSPGGGALSKGCLTSESRVAGFRRWIRCKMQRGFVPPNGPARACLGGGDGRSAAVTSARRSPAPPTPWRLRPRRCRRRPRSSLASRNARIVCSGTTVACGCAWRAAGAATDRRLELGHAEERGPGRRARRRRRSRAAARGSTRSPLSRRRRRSRSRCRRPGSAGRRCRPASGRGPCAPSSPSAAGTRSGAP